MKIYHLLFFVAKRSSLVKVQLTVGNYNSVYFSDNLNPKKVRCLNPKGQAGECMELGNCLQLFSQHAAFHQTPFNFEQSTCPFNPAFEPVKICCVNPFSAGGGGGTGIGSRNNVPISFPPFSPQGELLPSFLPNRSSQKQQPNFPGSEQRTTSNPPRANVPEFKHPKGSSKAHHATLQELSLLPSKEIEASIQNHPNFGLLPTEKKCGKFHAGDRVIGGEDAALGAYPWMTLIEAVEKDDPSERQFGCSGALISEKYVLTAAHCVIIPHEFKLSKVRVGEYDKSKDPDCNQFGTCAPKPEDIDIESWVVHKDYDKTGSTEHDIALIRLKTPAKFGSYVVPICLPIRSNLVSSVSGKNKQVIVAGWGRINNVGEKTSDILQHVTLPLVSNNDCYDYYKSRVKMPKTEERFCAAGEGDKDSCKGDSGSPVMALLDSSHSSSSSLSTTRIYQLGIVSIGVNCSLPNSPSLYTHVLKHMPWILDNIKP